MGICVSPSGSIKFSGEFLLNEYKFGPAVSSRGSRFSHLLRRMNTLLLADPVRIPEFVSCRSIGQEEFFKLWSCSVIPLPSQNKAGEILFSTAVVKCGGIPQRRFRIIWSALLEGLTQLNSFLIMVCFNRQIASATKRRN